MGSSNIKIMAFNNFNNKIDSTFSYEILEYPNVPVTKFDSLHVLDDIDTIRIINNKHNLVNIFYSDTFPYKDLKIIYDNIWIYDSVLIEEYDEGIFNNNICFNFPEGPTSINDLKELSTKLSRTNDTILEL